MNTTTPTWTRNSDGSYTSNGWVIRRVRNSGSGQAAPFTRVNTKTYSAWQVYDPEGFLRTGGASLAGAKVNANRQIELRVGRQS